MLNALTIDVEDYFQVNAFVRQVPRHSWDSFPLRVEDNTCRILEMLDQLGLRGTFFILGWVAERKPELVRKIQRHGHEIASHGYGHELIYQLGPKQFHQDLSRGRKILEDICGHAISGYRAPSYSITRNSLWALDILMEEGFSYDSSIFPIIHDTYGIPDAPRFPCLISRGGGTIREFPLTTLPIRFGSREYRLPIAGGGYLRLMPEWLISRGIASVNQQEQQPVVLYFHPWEIDPGQPRIKAGLKSRLRHYLNLDKTEGKVRSLLEQFRFGTMGEVLSALPLDQWCGQHNLTESNDRDKEKGCSRWRLRQQAH
jgi:polysaccharide deacetylase family protein (PEP-CTERM system associated)